MTVSPAPAAVPTVDLDNTQSLRALRLSDLSEWRNRRSLRLQCQTTEHQRADD
jgi:hypothetical protein